MSGDSKAVSSPQRHCHPKLGQLVRKHLQAPTRRPAAQHTRQAFDRVRTRAEASPGKLIFDSYCGTGMSTRLLAEQHQDCLVIGIDKSAQRLSRHDATAADNYLLVQADCGDFWRLALAAGWRLQRHYLLYPNPWPKRGQLKRRLHGSADLPALLALGGSIELRSNWQVYVEEFGSALTIAGEYPVIDLLRTSSTLSLHERKYADSGHSLWRCRCKLVHNTLLQTHSDNNREVQA